MNNGKAPLKIGLLDLNHMTLGVHTNTVPLGCGLIAKYLKKSLRDEFDVRIFKDPKRFLDDFKKWRPDVLGISQYSWNTELNFHMAKTVKRHNTDCVVIAGGPDLCLSADDRTSYLRKRPEIDICVMYDGEIPFASIIKRLISGEVITDIRKLPSAGTYSIDRSGRLRESAEAPPRLKTLDEFGAIYADGSLNRFLDDGYNPFLQTHRGCPFSCIYCHTSDSYYSRMLFQSPGYFEEDMRYLGKRFAGQHDVALYLANTNFGLFKEDLEIARIIRKAQDKHDWPRYINVNSGKDTKKLFELLSILKYKFNPSISLQTLTPKVLKRIGRRNISFKDFVAFQDAARNAINKKTTTELILSLPGESKRTFEKTVSDVLDSGVQNIVIYTLMALNGTPIASKKYAKKYDCAIRHRIVPRCFSEIDGAMIFETEKVIVGTDTMPFKDYMDLRALALLVTVFAGSSEMFPIRKSLIEHGLSVARWVFGIRKDIANYPEIYSAYKEFLNETRLELFPSRKALIDFFSKNKNYEKLLKGALGDNLLRKYKAVLLSCHYEECVRSAMRQLRRMNEKSAGAKIPALLLDELELFVMMRNTGYVFDKKKSRTIKKVRLHYNIPKWLDECRGRSRLKDLSGKFKYSVAISHYAKNRISTYTKMNRDPELSLQILYRDGLIEDFWPVWVPEEV